jgi:uncharacterized Zn-binding protein involved in type VI secretion
MPAASYHTATTSGHANWPPTTSVTGSPNVFVNGGNAINVGSPFVLHCNTSGVCHAPTASGGSGTVFINGQPACRIGDALDCGDSLASGSSNVFIGG